MQVPQLTTTPSKSRWESMSRIWLKRMVSRSTVRPCCSVSALAWAGKPQHRKGGGRTTRVPVSRSTWMEAWEIREKSRSEPQPGK